MVLFERRPAPPLDAYVERLCYWEGLPGPHRRERVLPNGRFQIIVNLADGFFREEASGVVPFQAAAPSIVVGMQTQYSVVDTAAMRLLMGAVLRPGGTHGLFDIPADAFHNQVVSLDLVWGAEANRLPLLRGEDEVIQIALAADAAVDAAGQCDARGLRDFVIGLLLEDLGQDPALDARCSKDDPGRHSPNLAN